MVRTRRGTSIPREPRWKMFRVSTDSPEANDTRQMVTP